MKNSNKKYPVKIYPDNKNIRINFKRRYTTLCRRLFPLLLLLCCFACKEERYFEAGIIEFDGFKASYKITGEDVPLEIMGAGGLSIYDSLLFVHTGNPDGNFSVVNLNDSLKVLASICRDGRGPNEYISFSTNSSLNFKDGADGHLKLYTYNSLISEMVLDVTESLNKGVAVISQKRDLPKQYRKTHGVFPVDGGDFVKYPTTYNDARDNIFFPPRYLFVNNDGSEEELVFFGKKLVSPIAAPMFLLAAYDGDIRIKPDKTKVVDGFTYMDYIMFLDIEKKSGFGLKYKPSPSYGDIENMSYDRLLNTLGYTYEDVTVTDDYVFGLFDGKTAFEEESGVKTNPTIRIFDWDGTPLANIELDRIVTSIAMDSQTGFMYGIDSSNEKISRFYIGDILNDTKN